MGQPAERLHQLEAIERDISSALQAAGQALTEFSRDKPNVRQVENHTSHFMKTLEGVESGLSKHIDYLTQAATSQPHEGSSYAAQKDLQMAFHRLEHVKSRLTELERMRGEHLRPAAVGATMGVSRGLEGMQRSISQPTPSQSAQRVLTMGDLATQPGVAGGMQRSFSHKH